MDQAVYDAIIVGYGPVGQTAAALLSRSGMTVGVVERHVEMFGAPRAVHCDDEIVRIFQQLGIADEFIADTSTVGDYVWQSASGERLLTIPGRGIGDAGWLKDNFFVQPRMERLLQRAVTETGAVDVLRGSEAVAVQGDDPWAPRRVIVEDRQTGARQALIGTFVLGADGANSIVRSAIGARWEDLGFQARWLVVDLRPFDPDAAYTMLDNAQICDPARPTTLLRWIGRDHCRLEFMLQPEERAEEFASAERIWELVTPWGPTPADAELVRHAVYAFRSLVADRWSAGHTFLLGDAAHLMPPFLGQGMCAGMRDAHNLAWKLDLARRGLDDRTLFSTYDLERRPHVIRVMETSMALGRVVCVTDVAEAAERDRRFIAGDVPPPPTFPQLTDGLLLRDGLSLGLCAGISALQANVRAGTHEGRFDDVVGRGWVVLSRRAEGLARLTEDHRRQLDELAAHLVHVTPAPADGAVVDLEHRYAQWFERCGCEAMIVRPDHYVFGAVADAFALPGLVEELLGALPLSRRSLAV